MNGAANALLWRSSETENFTLLIILKQQNTNTSLNKPSKKHWVIALFGILGSVRKNYNLQSLMITLEQLTGNIFFSFYLRLKSSLSHYGLPFLQASHRL